jgi:hypothetical protein
MITRDRINAVMRPSRYASLHAAAMHDERRWAQRRTGIMPGFILTDRLQAAVMCVVRDMSATGAQVELIIDRFSIISTAEGLPNTFRLVLRTDDADVECQVAWREERRLGVRFIGAMRHLPKKQKLKKPVKKR